jgi:hypothetical protein
MPRRSGLKMSRYSAPVSTFPQRRLFDFTLHMQEIRKLDVAGTFSLKTRNGQTAITRDDITLYDIYAEYSMLATNNGAGFRSVRLDWDSDQNPLENNGISFAFTDKETLIANAVCGLLTIVVKAYDGSVVWSRSYKKDDPVLTNLHIETALQRPNKLQDAEKRATTNKKLRGKLIAINSTASLKDVTILVQAKKEGDAVWRIAAACNTDAFGNFVMPYPYGQYVAAQAVVALTPNSPADIPVHVNDENDACIADDFLYLLIKDVQAPEESQDEGDDGACACQSPKQVPRLPDHNDLINSNEYSQDLGDFSKRISLITVQKLDGSEYPTWATQDGVPIGSRPPAWLFCQAQCPFDTPCGSAPRPDGCLSTSYSWPIPALSRHRPTSSHSSAVPKYPSTVQWDCICCDRAGNTAGGWVCQSGRHTAPCGAETACEYHYFLVHYPF